MAKNERAFSGRTRQALKSAGVPCYPVETGGTAVGFPDLVLLGQGGPSLVELKSRKGMPMALAVASSLEGPGQKAFARDLSRRSAFMIGQVIVTSHSFLLVECMDGVALLVEEEKENFLAASWEDMPSGADLRDAVRAWRTRCSPARSLEGIGARDALMECARAYTIITGIDAMVAGESGVEGTLDGKEKAVGIARVVCGMGRIALLMESMRENEAGLAPLEGGNGYVIVRGD